MNTVYKVVSLERQSDQWFGIEIGRDRRLTIEVTDDSSPEERAIHLVESSGEGPFRLGRRLCGPNPIYRKWVALFERHQIPLTYDSDTLSETQAWVKDPGIDDPSLLDFTHLPFITIDNEDSRDLDQALFVDENDRGYCVWYALADASYYVKPGSALFRQAVQRGTSFYLPGLSTPMLPHELSEGVISLNQNQLRRALVFEMNLDHEGHALNTTIHRARIRSRRKMSYEGVQRILDGIDETEPGIARSIEMLRRVGLRRMAIAHSRHVIKYRQNEITVRCGPYGRLGFQVVAGTALDVERYNEQISLLCNIEGAKQLQSAGVLDHVQPVYKVHPSPLRSDLENLAKRTRQLAHNLRLNQAVWSWAGPKKEPLSDYLARLPKNGDGGRLAKAIDRQARMVNHRSEFQDEPGMHFGIGAEIYARFSAPMREIVGIFTHKELLESMTPGTDADNTSDVVMRQSVIDAGNRAKTLQGRLTRSANETIMELFFQGETQRDKTNRPHRSATVMGLTSKKIYVQFDDPPMEVKLYTEDLTSQLGPLQVDKAHAILADSDGNKKIWLGQELVLVVRDYHRSRRRWLFDLID